MDEPYRMSGGISRAAECLTLQQQRVLERALAKVVVLGEQVGVSIDEMILLLGSGLTVMELVDYLAERGAKCC